jgi:outer membrane protein assembly factor BamB
MNIREQFEAEIPEYGYAESVYIDGERLYCNPAGRKGFMVCLDKNNGDLIWANKQIPGTVGFSSQIVAAFGGYRQIIGLSSNCVYGVDAETGKLLWTVPYENDRSNNVPDAIFHKGTMKLVKVTPDNYELVSSFEVPEGGKGMYWAHPVICGGRLYIRHADQLYAYDVRER